MADHTKIEWCDSTFNPWIGCTKVSPACDHCYAEGLMDGRLGRAKWGAGQPRVRTSDANWRKPLIWDRRGLHECVACGWRGEDSELAEPRRVCPACSGSTFRAARRRVFCASLADVFDNEVPEAWRIELFDLIRSTPNLDWLLLTKRVGNVTRMLHAVRAHLDYETPIAYPLPVRHWVHNWIHGDAPPNVWIGATICNQAEADRDIQKLRATPAAVRFLSIEPMLGPVNLNLGWNNDTGRWDSTGRELPLRRIDWVIAGGESGPHARPMHPDWVRSLRDQCAADGVPFLFKQWGEWAPFSTIDGKQILPFGDYAPSASPPFGFIQRGKKAAGRTLDGREHNGFPGDCSDG